MDMHRGNEPCVVYSNARYTLRDHDSASLSMSCFAIGNKIEFGLLVPPDFLSSLLVLANFMRLSLLQAACVKLVWSLVQEIRVGKRLI
jgi:hypothetical protein